MKITEVRVFPKHEEKLRAYAAVTFDDCFVVHNLRVVQSDNKGLMVCMPSRKRTDGTFKDICHPITTDFRQELESLILNAYDKMLVQRSQKLNK